MTENIDRMKPVIAGAVGNPARSCAQSCEGNAYRIEIRRLTAERDALSAKLAELEGQEPALYVQSNHFAQAKFSPFLARVCQQPIEGIATMPLYAAPPVTQERHVFWYRPRSDGGYDGPIHDSQIEQVRRESGAWVPLIAMPIQPTRGEDQTP